MSSAAVKRDGVATFFLSKFLGCELSGDAQAVTRAFFMATLAWINDRINDPDSQAKYFLALITEMNAEDRDIDPGDFARRNLDPEDCNGFLQYLAASNVSVTVFEMNVKLIKTQLRGMRINIENNIVVLVPPNQADMQRLRLGAALAERLACTGSRLMGRRGLRCDRQPAAARRAGAGSVSSSPIIRMGPQPVSAPRFSSRSRAAVLRHTRARLLDERDPGQSQRALNGRYVRLPCGCFALEEGARLSNRRGARSLARSRGAERLGECSSSRSACRANRVCTRGFARQL